MAPKAAQHSSRLGVAPLRCFFWGAPPEFAAQVSYGVVHMTSYSYRFSRLGIGVRILGFGSFYDILCKACRKQHLIACPAGGRPRSVAVLQIQKESSSTPNMQRRLGREVDTADCSTQ